MLMILGATFTGMACWLVLAESGVRPSDGRWARGLHVLCAGLTLQGLVAPQGEFTFGVPQFSHLFHPILICLAGGMALVAIRLVHGPYWTLGIVTVSFILMGTGVLDIGSDQNPVDTRFGGVFIAGAVVVELVAALLGTDNRLRFAIVSGLGIGTIGLAAEWAWNANAYQRWTSALLPEAAILGVIAAVGAAILGAACARAIAREGPSTRLPGVAIAIAAVACLAVIVFPLRRPTGDVEVAMQLTPAGQHDGNDTVDVVARLTPASAATDAYWFQATAWQGGGLELADMKPTGVPGEYRSEKPVPVGGKWKSLLRLHRGAEMMAAPIFLPADPKIGEVEIPAVDRTAPFVTEREYLLRETHSGNGWLSPAIHLALVFAALMWALTFVIAVRGLTGAGDRQPPRGATRLAREPIPST